jgi:NTE family protein
VLKCFADHGIKVDMVSGTSAGAMVAASFGFDMPVEEIAELARGLDWRKLSSFARSRLGINTNKRMGIFLTDTLGDVKIEDSNIPLTIVATNIETHEMVLMRSGSLREAIRASTCIPGLFVPVEHDGMLLVDGGLTENLPLTALEKMGADIKIGVDLIAHAQTYRPKNVGEVLMSSITVIYKHRDAALRHKADILIEPDLSRFNSKEFKDIDAMIDEGYRAAEAVMPQIKKLLEPEKAPGLFAWLFGVKRS